MQKISATILEFGQPYLDELPTNPTKQVYEAYLAMIVSAWNSVVIDEWNGNEEMQSLFLKQTRSIPPPFKHLPKLLLDRKKQLFADDHRAVGNHEVIEKKGEWIFRAEARGKNVH
jgi:hypothetical protein